MNKLFATILAGCMKDDMKKDGMMKKDDMKKHGMMKKEEMKK